MTNTLPTFNFTYQDVYTSEIEFNTQIIEKQRGEEQRYPKWTYPKRTFTLKFDKNADDRDALKDFFVDVMSNYGGQFYYVWDVAKGGNGETYTCWFDLDSLQMSIKDYGFCETSFKFITIDKVFPSINTIDGNLDLNTIMDGNLDLNTIIDGQYVDETTFNFRHKADADYNVAFNKIQDKIFNANYKIRQLWQAPRRSWTLTFQKDDEVRKQLETFFIMKRGKFRYFQWKWKKEYGGDDVTYNVRFDTDILNMDIEEYGFSEFQIKLKEVIPNPSPTAEYEKDEIIPRKLLKIELTGGDINILDNETLESLTYNNVTYIGAPLDHGEITKDDNSSVAKLELSVSNVGQGISGIIGNRGNVIGNAPATLTMILLNVNSNSIISGSNTVLWYGLCNNLTLTNETAKMDVETPLGGYEYTTPNRTYKNNCSWRKFKDCRCGYTGSETTCDRTYARCTELNNTAHYGGFLSICQETLVKA